MGLNFDVTAATPILKVRYTEKKIETLAFVSSGLAKMPKKTDGGGLNYRRPPQRGPVQRLGVGHHRIHDRLRVGLPAVDLPLEERLRQRQPHRRGHRPGERRHGFAG